MKEQIKFKKILEALEDAIANIKALHDIVHGKGNFHSTDEFCVFCQWLRHTQPLIPKAEGRN